MEIRIGSSLTRPLFTDDVDVNDEKFKTIDDGRLHAIMSSQDGEPTDVDDEADHPKQ